MNEECPNQLDWLALCYAAGEMDRGESERFEARLADDQAAREALARAVELTQLVAAAEGQGSEVIVPARRAIPSWQTRLSWMALGGLAAALLAMLWPGAVGTSIRGTNASKNYELAAAWNQARAESSDLWMASGGSALDEDDTSFVSFRSAESEIDETPSWLTAAVFGPPQSDSETTSDTGGSEALEE